MRIWVWSISLPWLLMLNASPQVEVVRPLPQVEQDLSGIPVVKLWGRVWYAHPEALGELYTTLKPMLTQVSTFSPQERPGKILSGAFCLPQLSPLQLALRHFSFPVRFSPVLLPAIPQKQGIETRAGPFFC